MIATDSEGTRRVIGAGAAQAAADAIAERGRANADPTVSRYSYITLHALAQGYAHCVADVLGLIGKCDSLDELARRVARLEPP